MTIVRDEGISGLQYLCHTIIQDKIYKKISWVRSKRLIHLIGKTKQIMNTVQMHT